jgi:7,8-dihydropterin-6-yl-methyl-4-(beta-D-ribofuranosyl)aminobenzene 5'-phosphate synthase
MKTVRGRLTVLTDNTVPERSETIAEHGFAAFLETEKGNFLFDTGRGKAVVHNAAILKKDLSSINKIVLSHAHGDHTGGLPDVLQTMSAKQIDVFAHPDVFADRFRKKKAERTYGGIPFVRGYLEKMGARFVFNKEYVEIEEGVFLTGEVPRKTSFEVGDMGDRLIVREGKSEPDIILDDQSLVIQVKKGLLIVLGCAHAGIINVLSHAVKMSGVENIYAVVGGTHIGLSGDLQRDKTLKALKDFKIEHLIPAHCTGAETMCRMRSAFKDSFQFSHVGMTLDF